MLVSLLYIYTFVANTYYGLRMYLEQLYFYFSCCYPRDYMHSLGIEATSCKAWHSEDKGLSFTTTSLTSLKKKCIVLESNLRESVFIKEI